MLYNDSELQMNTKFILCVTEIDKEYTDFPIDMQLFIGWDETTRDYFVRGKRQDTAKTDFVPFAFHCKSSKHLYDFIKSCIHYNRINITLYNFNNIEPNKPYNLTYEFFESQMDNNYVITGYDYTDAKYLVNYIRLLKKMYNH